LVDPFPSDLLIAANEEHFGAACLKRAEESGKFSGNFLFVYARTGMLTQSQ
jgi:hypothetical protein